MVQELYSGSDDVDDLRGLTLGEQTLVEDLLEQFTAPQHAHHEVHTPLILVHVPQRHDVWVMAIPQQDLHLFLAVPLPFVYYLLRYLVY